MTRPSLTPNGLTPAERERYEAQPGLAPELRPPGQPGGMEPIGAILARLAARNGLKVPKHLDLPMAPKRAKSGKEQRERDKAVNSEPGTPNPKPSMGRPRDWLRDSPVQGYPGRFMDESAKEASD